MNLNEDWNKKKSDMAFIVKGIRLYFNLAQVDMAEVLRVKQGTVSKIEKGELELSAMQWLGFCKRFSIHPFCSFDGYVLLSCEKVEIGHHSNYGKKGSIAIEYSKKGTILIESLVPILEAIKDEGEEVYHLFLKSIGAKQDYFCLLNNKVNFNCFQKIYDFLKKSNFFYKGEKSFFCSLNYNINNEHFSAQERKNKLKLICESLKNS